MSDFQISFDVAVGIQPIPTGAGGIFRGATITVNGNASCTMDTLNTKTGQETSAPSPESITKVEVQFGSTAFVKANPTGPVSTTTHQATWSTWSTGARTIIGVVNNALPITACVTAGSVDGVISTRQPNGADWLPITGNKSPIGEWTLTMPNSDLVKNLFRGGGIEDILLVITYAGRTPEWPA